ncbi:MAG: hypothetical protein DRO05_05040 [Thermoproteota archaeon]|nr:MAG: hypothetical protein DRO05_05040 [Candidatus Korarchaeota archaeon]
MKVSQSSYAYTPGLKIKRVTIVRKERKLPIPGEVLVKKGDKVSFDTVVARTYVPGDPYILKVARELGIEPEDLPFYMLKKKGDRVKKGEVVARYRALFGMINRECISPTDGVIEDVSSTTGRIIVRGDPKPVEIKAYVSGKIVEVMPKEGVVVETRGAFVQGIFGVGGETNGEIKVLVDSPSDVLEADMIDEDCRGKILIGGSLVTKDALNKAIEFGARGIVVGGIKDTDLMEVVGYEIGVAITGHEEIGLTLIITEGFGKMAMSRKAFEIFKEFEGYRAAMNGATQIRAGVIRPEVVIPHEKKISESELPELEEGIRPGTLVRIIREPYFGQIGRVVSLPIELQVIETESKVRVAEVELEGGKRVVVPRANLEIIEE